MDKAKYEPVVNDIIYVRSVDEQVAMYKVCKFIGAGEMFIINRSGYLWDLETFLKRIEEGEWEICLIMRDGLCAYESKEGELVIDTNAKGVAGHVRNRNDSRHQ